MWMVHWSWSVCSPDPPAVHPPSHQYINIYRPCGWSWSVCSPDHPAVHPPHQYINIYRPCGWSWSVCSPDHPAVHPPHHCHSPRLPHIRRQSRPGNWIIVCHIPHFNLWISSCLWGSSVSCHHVPLSLLIIIITDSIFMKIPWDCHHPWPTVLPAGVRAGRNIPAGSAVGGRCAGPRNILRHSLRGQLHKGNTQARIRYTLHIG